MATHTLEHIPTLLESNFVRIPRTNIWIEFRGYFKSIATSILREHSIPYSYSVSMAKLPTPFGASQLHTSQPRAKKNQQAAGV